MQIWIENPIYIALGIGALLFLFYIVAKTCTGGPISRLERKGGTPRTDDLTSTEAALGSEVSYSPSTRASSAGPFPVGGRQERLPTRSFEDYTDPREKRLDDE
ncbi:MAG: hypothetical protein C4K49_10385 [Candidatus Thorarchaeota archaeon]|nr:MAG: hypothetical protein C4K49_10385 [Candidatus Thorarchaeota archaeon]